MNEDWEEISDINIWESYLQSYPQKNFLQSFAFGNFQEKLGNKVWRLHNSGSICQVIKLKSKTGPFFYVPGGPLLKDWTKDLPLLIDHLANLGKQEKVSFVRCDPRVLAQEQINLLKSLGLKEASFYTQPQCTLTLDLTKSLEELRSNLSSSTRYNVGWVARQGVSVEVSTDSADIEIFLKLLQETAIRQGFRLTDLNYYKEQFLAFHKLRQAKLYLTRAPENLNKQVLAAAVVIYYADRATYLHAASSSLAPKLRAPYLMQWQIINDAKHAGFKTYDFWGVAASDDPKDPWAGVSEFKKSFGGERVYYEKPYDLVINKNYYMQVIMEKLRKIVRKFR